MKYTSAFISTALWLFVSGSDVRTTGSDRVFFMELPPTVLPSDVGASPSQVVGTFFSGGGFYWTPTSGTTPIGGRSAIAVSLDGSRIVGRALDARGLENAAIWKSETNWRVLGSFRPDSLPCDQNLSGTFGANYDGRVIVGLGWDGCAYARAFRWEQATGMIDLGSLNGRSSRANAVSGDGLIVVGWQQDNVGFRQAAKWVNLREALIIGPNGPVGEALGANRDGAVIVGKQCNPLDTITSSAWMRTRNGGVRCFPVPRPPTLPNLPYLAAMQATSDDGRVIGGSFSFGLDSEALLWLDGQMYFLKDFLRNNGYPDAFRGWINTGFVTGVSPDGRTLVGYGAGPTTLQGYLVMLP